MVKYTGALVDVPGLGEGRCAMGGIRSRLVGAASIIAIVAGCANLNSIDRTTHLPTPAEDGTGRAVHLDAQQRLMVVNNIGQYCAEPSPDALAAYAASLGLGIGIQGTGSGALSAGQQSAAASIGLRTQSITLMRDALYRMCEAYANGAVGPAQIATLLGRSQHLTAVILAVEQLTGAVSANQAALTSQTAADASATMLATQDLLTQAISREERAQRRLEAAEHELQDAKTERDAADRKLQEAREDRANLGDDPTDRALDEANAEVAFRESERDRAQSAVEAAQARRDLRQKALDAAQQSRAQIEENQDAATASASTSTGSGARFSTPGAARQLSADATKAVAGAVETMVTAVLDKEYTMDSCMAMLTLVPRRYKYWTHDQRMIFDTIQIRCFQLVNTTVTEEIERITTTSGIDRASRCLKRWLDDDPDDSRRARLEDWMKSRGLSFSVATFITASETVAERLLAIIDLKISCDPAVPEDQANGA